jgi:hypothetical protein
MGLRSSLEATLWSMVQSFFRPLLLASRGETLRTRSTNVDLVVPRSPRTIPYGIHFQLEALWHLIDESGHEKRGRQDEQ